MRRRLLVGLAVVSLMTFCKMGAGRGDGVNFRTSDGFNLEGRLFGKGAKAVILVHMFPSNQRSWSGFASNLADDGYQVLTFNFRGYGESQGAKDIPSIHRDVTAAIRFMTDEQQASSVVLVGASMGGTASLIAADLADVPVATLSAPVSFMGLDAGKNVAGIQAPKLFIAADGDAAASKSARELFRLGADPEAGLELVIGAAHGTALLRSEQSEKVVRLLKNFIAKNS